MQQIYSENPPCFHMHNVLRTLSNTQGWHFRDNYFQRLWVNYFCKKLYLRCLTGLWIYLCKMLCITSIMFKRKFYSHLHTLHLYFGLGHVLISLLNSNNEVVDLIYSGNVFHMFASKALGLLFQTLLYFEYGCTNYALYE